MALDDNLTTDHNSAEGLIREPLTRDGLYSLVWSEPMLKVGARFDVSSSYMARVCSLLNVPRPERGYWAKLAVGKASPKPQLPDPLPGDPLVWSRDGSTPQPRAAPRLPAVLEGTPSAPRNLWSPYRPTLVYVGTVAIGLVVIEMSEEVLMRYVSGKYIRDADYVAPKSSRRYHDHTWTTTKDLPCGRLRLVAYSPYWRASWQSTWQESKNSTLSRDIPRIVKAIEDAAIELVEKLKEASRQAEIARLERLAEEEKRWQEEDRRRVQQSIKDSKAHLGEIIQTWGSVMNVERFLMDVEERAKQLPANESQQVLERLKLARDFLGTQNPLDFFVSWKTPSERYQPLASRNTESNQEADEDEDEDGPDDVDAR